jgi:DNA-binding response OmpR family regulator
MRKKILIVDDEKEIVDFLEHFLNRLDFYVIKAMAGKDAVELFQHHNPDGTFLDIQLPDKDGITVLKELRELDPLARVIMITGKDAKEFQEKAKKCGAIDYITKPLDLSELKDRIDRHIL